MLGRSSKYLVCDARMRRRSRLSIFSKDKLEKEYGTRYTLIQSLANRNYKERKSGIDIKEPDIGIKILSKYLRNKKKIMLICGCNFIGGCHLMTITRLLLREDSDVRIILIGERNDNMRNALDMDHSRLV